MSKYVEFVVRGKVVNETSVSYPMSEAAKRRAPKVVAPGLKRVDRVDEATHSRGFFVSGYPPDVVASAKSAHENQQRLFGLGEAADPGPWSFDEWRAKNKPTKARSKAYEIAGAAETCAAMLRKAGWLEVRVEQDLRA